MKRYRAKLTIEVAFDAENRAQAETKMKRAVRSTRILIMDKTMVQDPANVDRIEELLF